MVGEGEGEAVSVVVVIVVVLLMVYMVLCGTCLPSIPNKYPYQSLAADRLVGLVVKASTSRAEDPGFQSRLRRDFSGVESYP